MVLKRALLDFNEQMRKKKNRKYPVESMALQHVKVTSAHVKSDATTSQAQRRITFRRDEEGITEAVQLNPPPQP